MMLKCSSTTCTSYLLVYKLLDDESPSHLHPMSNETLGPCFDIPAMANHQIETETPGHFELRIPL
jgi:hypothetical protein